MLEGVGTRKRGMGGGVAVGIKKKSGRESVTGKETPETLKPVPVSATELTATDKAPEDVRVKVCVAGIFRVVFPNEIVVALTPSRAPVGFRFTTNS